MNHLLRPRIWPSFSPSCRLYEPEAWRPRVSDPATYRSGTPRHQSRGTAGRLPGGTPILFALAPLRSVP
ncbi:MAG: hypothetical protein WBG24_04115, partial [Syntrophobacteria bacterium]